LIRPAVGRLRGALIIYDEFLASTEKGFTMSQKIATLEAHGYHVVESGSWLGQMALCLFRDREHDGHHV
jgi:hypothetical protein